MRNAFSALSHAVVIIACVVFIYSCGEPVKRKVVVWTYHSQRAEYLKQRVPAVEQRFAVEIEVDVIMGGSYLQYLQAAFVKENGPDIFEWIIENNRVIAHNPAESWVLPLEDFIQDSDSSRNIPPGKLSWLTCGTHVYGLPDCVHPVVLIYNDTLWKEAGVDVAVIETWDEFFEAARMLTAVKKNGKPLHYALPSFDAGLGDCMFMIWRQTGVKLLSGDGRPQLNSSAFREFVDRWLIWRESGAFGPWDWGGFADDLRNGIIAAYPAPDWWVSQVDSAVGEEKYRFLFRPLPVYRKGGPRVSDWGGTFLALPRNARDPAFLYAVMEALQYDREGMIRRFTADTQIPAWQAIWSDPVFHTPDARFEGQSLAELQTELAAELPPVVSGFHLWDIFADFNDAYERICAGEVDVNRGLEEAQSKALERYTLGL